MSQPLVSVVTPVYNEAEYLSECIESVLGQSYQDWDYTIVDNCSTDGSAEIAQSYAAKDSRIRVSENHEFLRAIPNYNRALHHVSPESKYCKIVLGDDLIFPECLDRMVAVAEEYPSVGIVGAYALEGRQVILTGLPYSRVLVPGREICRRHLLDGLYVFGSQNAVLYRSDIVRRRDPFYNEKNIHADTEVCFALLKEWDFGFVHQVLTFTRTRERSLSSISSDLHTHFPATLQLLAKYGAGYLTDEEVGKCTKEHLSAYYRFLGTSAFARRDRQFWDYHRRCLVESGHPLDWVRLTASTMAVLGDAVLNPKLSTERLFQHWSHRHGGTR